MFLRLLPALLSFVLLAAHFLRKGNLLMVALLLVCAGLLWVRRPWVVYTLQTILGIGVVIWILTASMTALDRIQYGEPWLRMAAILGAVSVFTGYAAWHFRHPRLRAWYGTDRTDIQEHASDAISGDDPVPDP